jgi:hypothetical protein
MSVVVAVGDDVIEIWLSRLVCAFLTFDLAV